MTRRQQLMEDYENALFALLMDEYMEEEGRRLMEENERLKKDPSAKVPEELDRRCLRTIRQAFARERRRASARSVYRVFSKVSVAAVLCAVLFATAFAASPALRVHMLNLLIEVSDVSTGLKLNGGKSAETAPEGGRVLMGYLLPEIPEGFELEYENYSDRNAMASYLAADGSTLRISVMKAENSIYNVDTEEAGDSKPIQVHGYDGLLIEKEGWTHIVWGDTQQSTFVRVAGTGIGPDVLLNFAFGITYVLDGDG